MMGQGGWQVGDPLDAGGRFETLSPIQSGPMPASELPRSQFGDFDCIDADRINCNACQHRALLRGINIFEACL
jgi:hypothetical protein